MDLDVFLSRQNIRHYRRLLDSSITPAERSTVLKLLAQEMVTLKGISADAPINDAPAGQVHSSQRR